MQHKHVSPTTMYAEGNPVIESPLSFATCIHDMLLQSWDGMIRVFPAASEKWADVAFHQFPTQGAFLVSAKRKGGETEFISIESLIGSLCFVHTDIVNPTLCINGDPANLATVKKRDDGFYEVALKQGETITFSRLSLEQTDLTIQAIPVTER